LNKISDESTNNETLVNLTGKKRQKVNETNQNKETIIEENNPKKETDEVNIRDDINMG
jgi:hypothetical protein